MPADPGTRDSPTLENFTFSPDGDLIAAGVRGGRVALINTTTGQAVRVMKSGDPSCLAFRPDGKAIAVCEKKSNATSIEVRSIVTGVSTKTIPIKSGEVVSVVWSPDSTTLVIIVKTKKESEDQYTAGLWNLTSVDQPREVITDLVFSFRRFTDARFSYDGKILAIGADDLVYLFDVDSRKELTQLKRQTSYVHDVRYLNNGQFIVDSEHLRFFDLRNARQLNNQRLAEYAVSSDGKRLAAYNPLLQTFEITEIETGNHIAKLDWDCFNIASNAVTFSPDRRFLLAHAGPVFIPRPNDRLMLFDAETGKRLFSFPHNARIVTFKPDGKLLAYALISNEQDLNSVVKVCDVELGREVQTINVKGKVSALAFNPVQDRLTIARTTSEGVHYYHFLDLYKVSDGQLAKELGKQGIIYDVAFSPDGSFLVSESSEKIKVWNAEGTQVGLLEGHTAVATSLSFSPDGKTLASASQDGEIIFWDYKKEEMTARLIVVGESDYIFVTPDNYYFTSRRGAASAVAFRQGLQAFSFEQFDVRFNRPDLVLKTLGSTNLDLIDVYAKAHQSRLKQYGLTDNFDGTLNLPEVSIDRKGIPRVTTQRNLAFQVKASDNDCAIARLNVYVNDVPIYGSKGLDVRELKRRSLERRISLELLPGNNRVQVSAVNSEGSESLRQTFAVTYEGSAPLPELYVLAIGVAKYADDNIVDLKYPADDAESIIKLFEERAAKEAGQPKGFYKVHPLAITDQNATIDIITAARKFLEQANTNDQVVVFLSGHGVLDKDKNYFFATHDITLGNPAARGLSYEALERLLDGLNARRKLLLIDTCHAGEVDKGELEKLKIKEPVKSDDGVISSFEATPKDLNITPVANAFQNSLALVGELFSDLRLGSGISVVSASGGLQYAFESPRWKGGVFTYALRLGLGEMQADTDDDDQITSYELRDFVRRKVPELTQDKQKPTYRRESVQFDDRIF